MKLFLIALLFVTSTGFGQNVKLSKQKGNTRNGKAIYYVLKSDPNIKHGEYRIKSWGGNEILLEGNYDHGKRIGKWTERYYGRTNNGTLKNTGNYEKDVKTGTWIYFDHKGDTIQVFDHTKNKLIYSIESSRSEYIGGRSALSYELNQVIPIPKELNTPGTNRFSIDTEVRIQLNSANKIERILFSKPIGYGIEEIIEKWLNDKSKRWIARQDGLIIMPLKFDMQF